MGNFMVSYFFIILDKFTGRNKPIRTIGDPDNQCPDKRRSTVLGKHTVLAMRRSLYVLVKNK